MMVQAWDSTRFLDRGKVCSLDSGKVCSLDLRFESGFGALSCVQCKIAYAFLIRVQCVGLQCVLNRPWFGNRDNIR
jgi:hypothetical protein